MSKERRQPLPPLGNLFDRSPPQSIEAEMALLGCLLLEPKRIPEIVTVLAGPEDFYDARHSAIYGTMLQLADRAKATMDLIILVDELRTAGQLDDIGGPDYLVELAEAVPSSSAAPHYAGIVAEKAQLRRLIDALSQGLYDAYHAGGGPDDARGILEQAQARVFDVCRRVVGDQDVDLATLLHRELARLEASEADKAEGIHTGYGELDRMTGGLLPGEMIVVAARPSMGKTALSLNVAEQIAFGGVAPGMMTTRSKMPVAFFSLEMSRESIVQRLIASRSKLSMQTLRRGVVDDKGYKAATIACGELLHLPLHIDDTPGLTISGLRARARRQVAEHGAKAIVVDYLQLLTAPQRAETRQVEVSAISRGIKELARELGVPIVCLAQLNRGTEDRTNFRPRMSDIRESGSIEQDADVIMLLHREDYYHTGDDHWLADNADKVGVAELIIAKQRNGPTGVVKLRWDPDAVRFRNFEHGMPTAGGQYALPV